ncbi:MAG: hypothetical protein RBT63_01205 [Bdellovibrionales bacterium]|jgi:hypothetical protein|nr:hypothetical protein [Bdellovibrionales bacterium]
MVQKKHTRTFGFMALALAASTAFTASCSFHQDPFEEKSEQIKKGIPPELDKEPPAPKPLPSDALRIDVSDFYTFKEEVTGEIALSGRVLTANPQFELSIDNMQEFPGAEFDAATGIFKWTPPRESTGIDYGMPKRLVVRLTAPSPAGDRIIGTIKDVLLYVTRAEVDPEIVSVDDLVKVSTREGEVGKFTVVVSDPDGMNSDGLRPAINAIPSKRGPSDISGLVYMEEPTWSNPNPVQDPADKKRWIFRMVLDLRTPSGSPTEANQRGRNFTRTKENFTFGLQVVSRFGRVAMKEMQASIITDVLKPEISWFDQVEVVAGQENVIQFQVYDPYLEGDLSVSFVSRIDRDLPGVAAGSCEPSSRAGHVLCRISYKPLATTKGDFDVSIEAINKSKVPGDIKFVKETFRRKIRVVPGQAPVAPATASAAPAAPQEPVVETPNAEAAVTQ